MSVEQIVAGISGFFGDLCANVTSIAEVGGGKIYSDALADFAARPQKQQLAIGLSIIFTGVTLLVSTVWVLKKWMATTAPLVPAQPSNLPLGVVEETRGTRRDEGAALKKSSARVIAPTTKSSVKVLIQQFGGKGTGIDSPLTSTKVAKKLERTISKIVIERPADLSNGQIEPQELTAASTTVSSVMPPPPSMVVTPEQDALLNAARELVNTLNTLLQPIQEESKASEFPADTANKIAQAFKAYKDAVPEELKKEGEILLGDVAKAIIQICPSYQSSDNSQPKVTEETSQRVKKHVGLKTDDTGVMPSKSSSSESDSSTGKSTTKKTKDKTKNKGKV